MAAHSYNRTLLETSFDDAKEQLFGLLRQEGFGVVSEVDMQDTLKRKFGVDFRRYCIVGACNAYLTHLALQEEPDVGILLPCNVVLQEHASRGVRVSVTRPTALFGLLGRATTPNLGAIIDQVNASLVRVFAALR